MSESSNESSNRRPWHYVLLWIIVLISLGLNVFLLVGLYNFQREAQRQMSRFSEIAEILGTVEMAEVAALEDFELSVKIDEMIPISLNVPFSDTFEVPINTTVPISTSVAINENIVVPINDVVSLNRDATIFISVLGQSIPVDIPIRADIPLNMQTNIPVDLEVPIQMEIPIDLLVEVPVDTSVPIDAEIPVQMDVPVTIPLEQMGFNTLLTQVRDVFRLLEEVLAEESGSN